jgi:hypothetical protein
MSFQFDIKALRDVRSLWPLVPLATKVTVPKTAGGPFGT